MYGDVPQNYNYLINMRSVYLTSTNAGQLLIKDHEELLVSKRSSTYSKLTTNKNVP